MKYQRKRIGGNYMPSIQYRYDNSNRPVQDGLNVSPADIMRMAQNGTPIGTQMSSLQPLEELQTPGFEVSAMYKRGVDICKIWNAEQDARESVSKSVHSLVDSGNFGINTNNAE